MSDIGDELANQLIDVGLLRDVLQAVEKAVKQEREECAKIADSAWDNNNKIGEAVDWDADCMNEAIAIAIRKRS